MENLKDLLLNEIEDLEEIQEHITNASTLIDEMDTEMLPGEYEEFKQANNFLFYFSELIQAIIDRKHDSYQVLNDTTNINEELQTQLELRSQICNQK